MLKNKYVLLDNLKYTVSNSDVDDIYKYSYAIVAKGNMDDIDWKVMEYAAALDSHLLKSRAKFVSDSSDSTNPLTVEIIPVEEYYKNLAYVGMATIRISGDEAKEAWDAIFKKQIASVNIYSDKYTMTTYLYTIAEFLMYYSVSLKYEDGSEEVEFAPYNNLAAEAEKNTITIYYSFEYHTTMYVFNEYNGKKCAGPYLYVLFDGLNKLIHHTQLACAADKNNIAYDGKPIIAHASTISDFIYNMKYKNFDIAQEAEKNELQ